MHQTTLDTILRPIMRRVNLSVWLGHAVGPAIATLGTFATALLLCKMLRPEWAVWSLLVLAALPAALIVSYRICHRRGLFFALPEIAEVVDHLYVDDGAIAAGYERPDLAADDAFYAEVSRAIEPRRPRPNVRYYGRRFGPVLVYLAVALAIPPRETQAAARGKAIMQNLTAPVAEKLETLAPFVPEEQLEQLRQNLEQIKKEEGDLSRQKWESIEDLEQRVDQACEAAAYDLAPVLTSLEKLSQSQSSLNSASAGGKSAMQQLQAQINDPNTKLSAQLRGDLGKMASQMKGGNFDRKEMQRRIEQMREQLSQCQGGGAGKTGKEGRAGNGQKGPDGDGNPGSGAPTRGRGDAALSFGDEKILDTTYQKKEIENQFLAGEDLVDMGITPLAPKAEPGAATAGGARQFGDQTGPAVSRTRISPSQRRVVEQYFSENK